MNKAEALRFVLSKFNGDLVRLIARDAARIDMMMRGDESFRKWVLREHKNFGTELVLKINLDVKRFDTGRVFEVIGDYCLYPWDELTPGIEDDYVMGGEHHLADGQNPFRRYSSHDIIREFERQLPDVQKELEKRVKKKVRVRYDKDVFVESLETYRINPFKKQQDN